MLIRYLSKKNLFIIINLSLFFFISYAAAEKDSTEEIAWQNIETKYTIIRYQSTNDLKKFDYKVKYDPEHSGLKGLFSSSGPDNLKDRVMTKVDVLFERVQKILDMRKKMEKVTINIYENKDQLKGAFFRIYKRQCRIRAWYRYKNNTVYINVKDLHEGMLAHELAHAIIDHYLLIRPPRATAEILARYVDSHLKRKVRSY
jgi:hypothetical protein